MSNIKKIRLRTRRRKLRSRRRLNTSVLPRVSVLRSLNHIYAQLIDDQQQKTIVSCSTLELKNLSGDKTEKAKGVGTELARKALEKGVTKACLDRGELLYHGRLKALADGAREGGLEI